jgi:hypothetical protein
VIFLRTAVSRLNSSYKHPSASVAGHVVAFRVRPTVN